MKINENFGVFALVLVVFGLWAASGAYLYSDPNRGTFGDMFGAINALFSGLAFAGVIYAILLQRRELQLQRYELSMNRGELHKMAEASQAQSRYMASQRKREDLYRLITKLSDRLNNNYNGNHLISGESIHKAMIGSKNVNENERLMSIYRDGQDTTTKTYQILRYIESDLQRLRALLGEYELATNETENSTPLPEFFSREYGEMIAVLYQYSLIKKDVYDYYCGGNDNNGVGRMKQ